MLLPPQQLSDEADGKFTALIASLDPAIPASSCGFVVLAFNQDENPSAGKMLLRMWSNSGDPGQIAQLLAGSA